MSPPQSACSATRNRLQVGLRLYFTTCTVPKINKRHLDWCMSRHELHDQKLPTSSIPYVYQWCTRNAACKGFLMLLHAAFCYQFDLVSLKFLKSYGYFWEISAASLTNKWGKMLRNIIRSSTPHRVPMV